MKKMMSFLMAIAVLVSVLSVPIATNAAAANLLKGVTGTSNYSTALEKATDGKYSTAIAGNFPQTPESGLWHTAWTFDDPVKINKVVFKYRRYNTDYLELKLGSKENVAEHEVQDDNSPIRRELELYGDVSKKTEAEYSQKFSFNAREVTALSMTNKYFQAANTKNEYPTIGEVEAYYVTPDRIDITADSDYHVAPGDSFNIYASVVDEFGDLILDEDQNGIVWNLQSDYATISQSGEVTVSSKFVGARNVMVTATSIANPAISTSKMFRLVDSRPGSPVEVSVSAPKERVKVGKGDTIAMNYSVTDSEGTALTGEGYEAAWSIDSLCNALEIDQNTGVITVKDDIDKIYDVKVVAELKNENYGGLSGSITFRILPNKNILLDVVGVSPWARDAANMTDGDVSTVSGGGNHSAGDWTVEWDLGEAKKMNKVVVKYAQYNTDYLELKFGGGSGDFTVRKDLKLDYKNPGDTMNQVYSFDARDASKITLVNRYLYATNGDDDYAGKYPKISEVEAYFVVPAGVRIDAEDVYTVDDAGITIEPKYFITDADGDPIEDSAYSGLQYSLTGSAHASIDENTGKISVRPGIVGDEAIVVKAACSNPEYASVCGEKTIILSDSELARLEFKDVPDFIMMNKTQESEATVYPEVKFYNYKNQEISPMEVKWSLKNETSGITVNKKTGALHINNGADAESVTLVCETADGRRRVEKEIKLNQKVNLLHKKPAWTITGWGQGSIEKALDSKSSTAWNSGGHSRGTSILVINMQGMYDANYMVLNLGNIANSTSLNVAGSDRLIMRNGGETEEIPESYTSFKDQDSCPGLYPIYNGRLETMGQSLWSARSEDASVEEPFYQEHILTNNSISSYLDTPMKSAKYVSLTNYALGITDDNASTGEKGRGRFSVSDFELYNTAPNYVEIVLPEDTDITTNAAEIDMSANVHNGIAVESAEPGSEGTWIASGFTITKDGKLTVPASNSFSFGSITYSYKSNSMDATAKIYAYSDNGTLRFVNNPTDIFKPICANGVKEENGRIVVPEGMTVEELKQSISFNQPNTEILIGTADGEEVENGTITAEHIVYIMYDTEVVAQMPVDVAALPPEPCIEVSEDGGVYKAVAKNIEDYEDAVLLLAEYDTNGILRQLKMADKKDVQELSLELNVSDGNAVKAMLLESFGNMRPIVQVR